MVQQEGEIDFTVRVLVHEKSVAWAARGIRAICVLQ